MSKLFLLSVTKKLDHLKEREYRAGLRAGGGRNGAGERKQRPGTVKKAVSVC